MLLFISATNFVIIINLRLRSVRGNELAIGQRYCAKGFSCNVLVCYKQFRIGMKIIGGLSRDKLLPR